MAEGKGIVVQGKNGGFALAGAVEAVLFVVADANNHAQNAKVGVLVFAKCTESGFGAVIFDVIDTIFDEIRRLNLIHFEPRFGALQFGEQGFEQAIAPGCRAGGNPGGVERGLGVARSGAEQRHTGRHGQRESECQLAVKSAHGFTSSLACAPAFAAEAPSSNPGGGKSGGRSC